MTYHSRMQRTMMMKYSRQNKALAEGNTHLHILT
jgi:hypothetical protein